MQWINDLATALLTIFSACKFDHNAVRNNAEIANAVPNIGQSAFWKLWFNQSIKIECGRYRLLCTATIAVCHLTHWHRFSNRPNRFELMNLFAIIIYQIDKLRQCFASIVKSSNLRWLSSYCLHFDCKLILFWCRLWVNGRCWSVIIKPTEEDCKKKTHERCTSWNQFDISVARGCDWVTGKNCQEQNHKRMRWANETEYCHEIRFCFH